MYPIIIVLLALIVGATSVIVSKQNDNPVEEVAERVIEAELGLPKNSIDLTPGKIESDAAK